MMNTFAFAIIVCYVNLTLPMMLPGEGALSARLTNNDVYFIFALSAVTRWTLQYEESVDSRLRVTMPHRTVI